MKRKASIKHCELELDLPLFFPSISSVKTNFSVIDYLKLIKACNTNNFLISAYDIHNQKPNIKSEIISILEELKQNDVLILMDSGNYESYWHKDNDWTISTYEEILKLELANIYFSFDDQKIEGKSISEITNSVLKNTASNLRYTNSLITPIIHAKPADLAEVCKNVVKELHPKHIAIPERLLGDGIVNRIKNLSEIRKTLNNLGQYTPIHILGTGSPFTLMLLVWAGADTFDGLEWCQTSIDPKTFQTYHFQLCELFGSSEKSENYSLMTLYSNLQFFSNFNETIQKYMEQNELNTLMKKYFSSEFLKKIGCQ